MPKVNAVARLYKCKLQATKTNIAKWKKNKGILFVLDHQPLAKLYELPKLTVQNMEIKYTLQVIFSHVQYYSPNQKTEKKREEEFLGQEFKRYICR